MRYLSWIFGFLLFLLALGFAAKNSDTVVLHYYLGYQWEAPMVVIVFAVFCSGTVAGIVASLGFIFRQRREIAKLRRELAGQAANAPNRIPVARIDLPEGP